MFVEYPECTRCVIYLGLYPPHRTLQTVLKPWENWGVESDLPEVSQLWQSLRLQKLISSQKSPMVLFTWVSTSWVNMCLPQSRVWVPEHACYSVRLWAPSTSSTLGFPSPARNHMYLFFISFFLFVCFSLLPWEQEGKDSQLCGINLETLLHCPSYTKSNLCPQWVLPSSKNISVNFPVKFP